MDDKQNVNEVTRVLDGKFKLPICVECKHYGQAPNYSSSGEPICMKSRPESVSYLVYGNHTDFSYLPCVIMRSPEHGCGYKGLLFEPKE